MRCRVVVMAATLMTAACAGDGSPPVRSPADPLATKFERALVLAEAVAAATDEPGDCDAATTRLDAIDAGPDGDAMTVLLADPRWPTDGLALKQREDARGQAYAERLMAALDRCGDHARFMDALTRIGLVPRKVSDDR